MAIAKLFAFRAYAKKRKSKLKWQLQSFLRFTQTQKYLTCSVAADFQKSIDISNSEVNDENTIIEVDEIENALLQSRERVTRTRESFNKFVEESSKEIEQFKYWSIFLDELYPVLCDLILSHTNGDRL